MKLAKENVQFGREVKTYVLDGDASLHRLILRIGEGIIRSKEVAKAMLKVDRGHYTHYNPYFDAPQAIGKSILTYKAM